MKILVAYDGSTSADIAIEDLRKAGLPQQAEALVVCVGDGGLPVPDERPEETESETSWTARLHEADLFAQKARDRIGGYFPRWTVSSEALWGSPSKVLLESSAWWHPDLIVAGSHGRSRVARLFLGSISMELIHKAPCSVRIARRGGSSTVGGPIRLVIGTDGSPESDAVVQAVAGRFWPERTEAHVISVVQTLVPEIASLEGSTFAQEPACTVVREADERERSRLKNVAQRSEEILCRSGLAATSAVFDGDPRDVILAEAQLSDADTIFVGARGLGRMERLLLGSVSSHVLTHARCTVEVVRPGA